MAREFGFKAELSFGRRGTFGQSYWAIYIQSTARDKRLQTKIIKSDEGWRSVPVTKHVKLGRPKIVTLSNFRSAAESLSLPDIKFETLIWQNLWPREFLTFYGKNWIKTAAWNINSSAWWDCSPRYAVSATEYYKLFCTRVCSPSRNN